LIVYAGKLAKEKHASLLRTFLNCGLKKFHNIGKSFIKQVPALSRQSVGAGRTRLGGALLRNDCPISAGTFAGRVRLLLVQLLLASRRLAAAASVATQGTRFRRLASVE
jgi:hypothetical protein